MRATGTVVRPNFSIWRAPPRDRCIARRDIRIVGWLIEE